MPRIACFHVPLFPLAARLRSEPDLLREAVVITAGNGSSAHVIAATRRARKSGIHVGQSLPQARAILPKVIARGCDAECERSAQEALLEVAERFSPKVEDAGEGVIFIDVTGMEIHWSESKSECNVGAAEQRLGAAAIQAVAGIGLPARIGIASSKLAAKIASELPQSPTIVPHGGERAFLAPLPLSRLSPEMEIATTLTRWGLGSIGDLAGLPEGEIASRLGDIGRELHWSARGIDPRPLIPRQVPQVFEEGMDLEWALVALEPFLFVANGAFDRLSKRLENHGLACTRLEITLRLEPEGFYHRAIEFPAPTRDVKTMLTLMRLDLEANPPGAPVSGFTFVAHPDKPRRAQLTLFGPPALAPDKLASTIARIGSMIGPDRIGTPLSTDAWRPERFAIASFDPPPPPDIRRKPRRARGLLAVRVLRPAVELEVIVEETPKMKLTSIRSVSPVQVPDRKPLMIDGSIRVAAGPWTLEEGWWSDDPIERDYWDVELMTGGIFRVYRERESERWFADALYD
ncbi:MAG TPA: DNA polymerase Y family protein [Thermoanaerobaculia bacterium]|nr:DNA polymerase Y family protein [Thermoanaerobaculia bacterium]